MSKKGLIKSTGVISLATALSRVLGFVRDIVIANYFGTAIYAQAFVVAFRIPNLMRDLVGEGAANAAFVPVLTEELTKKGKGDFFKLAQVILNLLFWTLLVMTAIGMFASPLIVRLMAPGFLADQAKFDVTVQLTRMLFPFLVLVGLWAYAMGVLNTLGHFAAPAFGSCLLNISMILCAMWFGENVFGLSAGVLAGGTLQLFMQFPPLYAHGWKMRLTGDFSHPKARKVGALLLPRALGACVYQINVFISTILASLSSIVGDGAVAALYYANRIWQLPLAIFGIALAQAILPAMSRHVALNDHGKLKDMLSFSLNILFFILIPSTVGLIMLGEPITKVLLQRGLFTAYSTQITASALVFYSLGLVACGGIKILVSAFYSMHDTMTPLKCAGWSLAANILFNIALMYPLKVGGLALATSASAVVNFVMLYIMLRKKIGDFGSKGIADSFLRVMVSSLVMAAALKMLALRFSVTTAVNLGLAIITGLAVFLLSSYLLNVKEMKDFLGWALKRR
jgi:putative peptidoglycan lipid II flippase